MIPVFELWKKAGTWEFMHPWIECILPWETAADCIEQVLTDTPPGIQVGGHVLLWPREGEDVALEELHATGRRRPRRLRPAPRGAAEVLGRREGALRERLAPHARLRRQALPLRLVDFTPDDWREHFGARWDELVELKRTYDPDGILNPGFLPFEAKHGAPAGTP
jgi:hypothetical protein